MATGPIRSLGKVTVTSSGTPVRLTLNESTPSARYTCHAFMVEALPTNTGAVYIMDRSNGVIATLVGVVAILAIPTTNILPSWTVGLSASANPIDLSLYYVDAAVSTDGVLVSALIL